MTTDDRGAAALAERLRVVDPELEPGDRPFFVEWAAAILGERGRFLPDGTWPMMTTLPKPELARLRRIEAAARDLMACGGRFYHDRDCPEDVALRAALEG